MRGLRGAVSVLAIIVGLGGLGALPTALPTAKAQQPQQQKAQAPTNTGIAYQIFVNANSAVSAGNYRSAMEALTVIGEAAKDMPEVLHTLAVAELLSGPDMQGTAFMHASSAAASGEPLYQAVRLLADPSLTLNAGNGRLLLTEAGAAQLRDVAARLASGGDNARRLAGLLSKTEPDGSNPVYPLRLVGGPDLMSASSGKLFTVSVDQRRFRAVEPKLLERMEDVATTNLNLIIEREQWARRLQEVSNRVQQLVQNFDRLDEKGRAELKAAAIELANLAQKMTSKIEQEKKNATEIQAFFKVLRNPDIEKQIADQRAKVAEVQNLVNTANSQLRDVETRVKDKETQLSDKTKLLSALEVRLQKVQEDVAVREQQLGQLQGELSTRRSEQTKADQREKELLSRKAAGEEVASQLAKIQAEKLNLERTVVELEQRRQAAELQLAAAKQEGQQLASAKGVKLDANIQFGEYHALIIGNDNYSGWPKLVTAVNDATVLADTLSKKYGFKTRLITDAKRQDIIAALEDYQDKLTDKDNLLLFYAGHGVIDENGTGYWVPVDGAAKEEGKALRTGNFVPHQEVATIIGRIRVKHLLLITDSCYSGALADALVNIKSNQMASRDSGGVASVVSANASDRGAQLYLAHMAKTTARVVITSGANEPVRDRLRLSDRNSVFARALFEALNGDNKGVIEGAEVFNAIRRSVIATATATLTPKDRNFESQTPKYAQVPGFSGDFLFVPRS